MSGIPGAGIPEGGRGGDRQDAAEWLRQINFVSNAAMTTERALSMGGLTIQYVERRRRAGCAPDRGNRLPRRSRTRVRGRGPTPSD